MADVRVRFAPSPTGYLHIGGARTALFNYVFARHNGGTLVLRIEDTDVERTIEDSTRQILSSLEWLGIQWGEGPYYQSQRRSLYVEAAQRLINEGKAYWCYCTPEELERDRKNAMAQGRPPKYDGKCRNLTQKQKTAYESEGRKPALRLRTPDEGTTVVNDLIHGDVTFENSLMGDFVILKSNGFPAYNFACVVDDFNMRMTHVIRADEHLSNTPKQIIMYKALDYNLPEFAHVPMILAPDRSKLSKRHGATSVEEFREKGYLPEAIINYLALLGWSPESGEDFFDMDYIINTFRLERVSKTPAIYDINKITWMNGYYLREGNPERLVDLIIPFFRDAGFVSTKISVEERDWLKKLVLYSRDRVKTLNEFPESFPYFFVDEFEYEPKGVKKHFQKTGVKALLEEACTHLETIPDDRFQKQDVEKVYREIISNQGIQGGALIHPTRLAITGRTIGPGLFEVMELLGKTKTINRLKRAVDYLDKQTNYS